MIAGTILGLVCLLFLIAALRTPSHMAAYRMLLLILAGIAGIALLCFVYLSVYVFPVLDEAIARGAGG